MQTSGENEPFSAPADDAAFVLDAFGAAAYELSLATCALRTSPRLNQLYGYPADHPLTPDDCWSRVHPDDRALLTSALPEAAASADRRFQREFRIQLPDGTVRWVLSRGEVLLDGERRPILIRGAAIDVTDRKQVEAALQTVEQYQRAILNSSSQSIVLIAPDYRLLLFNHHAAHAATAVYGQTMHIGQSILTYVAPDEHASFMAHFREALSGRVVHVEKEVVGLTATDWWEFIYTPIAQPTGAVGGVVFTCQIISGRKRAEANLAFLAEVSVDFAPLASPEALMRQAGEKLARYLNLSRCDFSIVDEAADRITTVYDWRRDESAVSVLGEHRITTFLSEAGRRHYASGNMAVVNDTQTSPLISGSREVFRQLGIRSVVDAPYLEQGRWTFLLSACRSEPSVWRDDEIALIRELASRLYLRLERARAEDALRESEERFRLLVEGARDYAMFLLAPDHRITYWSIGAERVFGWAEAEAVGRDGSLIFTPEDRADGAFDREVAAALTDGSTLDRRWHVTREGGRLFFDGTLIRLDDSLGALRGFVKIGRDATVQRRAEEAVARANAELEMRVHERTAALAASNRDRQALLRQLVTAQEEERLRIARDLHDQLGQLITGLLLGLKQIEQQAAGGPLAPMVPPLQAIALELAKESHRLAVDLRPTALDDVGLVPALERLVADWSAQTRISAGFHSRGLGHGRLSLLLETTIYRAVQEALTNVRKHAAAGNVSVLLERRCGEMVAIVEDDGQGYEVEAAEPDQARPRLGVRGMRERVAQVGGTLEIESAPGSGTTVFIRIPLLD